MGSGLYKTTDRQHTEALEALAGRARVARVRCSIAELMIVGMKSGCRNAERGTVFALSF